LFLPSYNIVVGIHDHDHYAVGISIVVVVVIVVVVSVVVVVVLTVHRRDDGMYGEDRRATDTNILQI
jgi:hypothetical protein